MKQLIYKLIYFDIVRLPKLRSVKKFKKRSILFMKVFDRNVIQNKNVEQRVKTNLLMFLNTEVILAFTIALLMSIDIKHEKWNKSLYFESQILIRYVY